ncbi:MAG: MFS transporter [Planctomycetaceae bacterium]|nr:MFS transporter [Planctomycetaceae bacterium]
MNTPTERTGFLQQYTGLPRTVHFLCLGAFLNRAGSFVIVFLSIYISRHLKLGETFATQCIGVLGLGAITASVVGGQLADRYGRRIVMLGALFGGSCMMLVLSRLTSPGPVISTIFVFAVITEMYRPACSAMIGDVTLPRQRSQAFSLFYISVNLGFAIAPPIGGLLADQSFQLLFWGDAITMAAFGIVVLFLVKETMRFASPGQGQHVSGHGQQSAEDENIPLAQAIRIIAADRVFLLYCLANLLSSMVFLQSFSTLPLYLTEQGYSESDYGFMIATNGILIVLLQLAITHWVQRFDRVGVLMAGELLIAAGFGVLPFCHSTVMFIASIVLWTLGEIAQAAYKQAIVADLAPPGLRARYMGMFGMSFSLGLSLGAPLGGQIHHLFGARVLWTGCVAVTLLATCLFALMRRAMIRRLHGEPLHYPAHRAA